MQRRRQRRIQNFKRHHLLYFCYSFLYYCTTNLIFDRHVISILALRYVLHEHVFCLQCFVIKFYPIAVRCLKDTSWKVVTDQIAFTAISCKISTWMLEERSRIKTSRISRNTLRPAFAAVCLFAWFEGRPSAFSHKGSLVHDEISAKKSAISWDEFPWSPGRYYFKSNRKKLSF